MYFGAVLYEFINIVRIEAARRRLVKGIQDKNSVAYFWLTNFSLLLQLIFKLTLLTSATKSNDNLVNQKLCNTVILDAL